jgi:hypothetical protein
MTDQPARVTPGEISALLEQARQLSSGASLDERIAYHAQKADLLSRIAADLGTIEAHDVAADAWSHAASLCHRAHAPDGTEAGR